MKSKNKILDSFEEFVALPLSILKNRIIQITGFKSDFVETRSIDVDLSDDVIRINCVNNENAYNLLSTVIFKREQRRKALLAQKQQEENKDLLKIVKS